MFFHTHTYTPSHRYSHISASYLSSTQLLQESGEEEEGSAEDDGSYREGGGEGVGISDLYDALYDINDNNMSADSDDVDGKGEQNFLFFYFLYPAYFDCI